MSCQCQNYRDEIQRLKNGLLKEKENNKKILKENKLLKRKIKTLNSLTSINKKLNKLDNINVKNDHSQYSYSSDEEIISD